MLDEVGRCHLGGIDQCARFSVAVSDRRSRRCANVTPGGKSLALNSDDGIIDRYVAIVNPRKVGFGLASMVHVSLARHKQSHVDHFIREVLQHPEILEYFATSGEADFHLRVVVEDIDAYNAFLDDFIFKIPGVSQVRSNIVLKEEKPTRCCR